MSNVSTYTKGSLFKDALSMAWPAVLESFFVSLAGMIDTMMVSSLGTYAVAATGLTAQPKFLALSFFFAINVAVSALVARRRGQEDQKGANQVLLTAMVCVIVLCVVITLITVSFADPIIQLCGSNPETHDAAVTYFRIIQAGMFFNVFSLVINSAQRGSGNTRISMTTNMTSSTVNVIFNYLLINGKLFFPALGITGAALATVLGTVVAFIMSVRSTFQKKSYVSIPYMLKEKMRPTFISLKSIYSLGSNILLENIAMRVGFITTAILAANLGTNPFAAHQVGMNFLGLAFSFGDGMQVAAVALIGRSLGQSDTNKAKQYGRICQLIGLGISIICAFIMFFGGETLFSLFFDDADVLQMGIKISRYIIIIVLFQISQIVYGGCLRGAGDVKYTLFASLISVTIIRTLVTWVLTSVMNMGLDGIWLGILADQVSRFILLNIRFRQGKWVEVRI